MKIVIKSQPKEVLETGTFFVDRRSLLGFYEYADDFTKYEILPGKLGLRGELWMGAIGLEGEFGLLIPPATRDMDAIGYSIQKGEWDWWRFLSCVTIPRGRHSLALLFSFSDYTFFDASHDVVSCLESSQLKDDAHEIGTYSSSDNTPLAVAWKAAWRVFQREFCAEMASTEHQDL